MSDMTANLGLPYLQPAQAQKHVTHNEALQMLDAAAQLVLSGEASSPPADAAEGDCFVILADASGDWTGREGRIAVRQDESWLFLAPRTGWRAHDRQSGRAQVFVDGAWQDERLPPDGTVATLGVNASADSYNRLVVGAPASLFSHAGAGHRMSINKEGTGDTASLVFQSGWQAHAEIGLAGTDNLSVKVSDDGVNWVTALAFAQSGLVSAPLRPMARASLSAGALTPDPAGQTGFDTLQLANGGFSLGASVGAGLGNRLVAPAAGIYLAALQLTVLSSASDYSVRLLRNGATTLATIVGETVGTGDSKALSCLIELAAGDSLTLAHSGNAQVDFSAGKTELSLVYL